MKIALITGSLPPEPCGVGDYTYNLSNALIKKGLNVTVLCPKKWKPKDIYHLYKELKNYSITHMQYPTLGYGYSIGPHFLSLIKPMVITLHEASQAHILRFISLFAFTINSQKLIFTSKYEKEYFEKFYPYIKSKTYVIPIGSNIPFCDKSKERRKEIVYFGLIAPNKNLEDFIKLASLIKNSNLSLNLRIIGKIKDNKYYQELKYISKDLNIIWNINLNEKEVCEILSETLFAYLPFPDGASERRGTLLATLGNGVVTITTEGRHTTEEIKDTVLIANNPQDAFEVIKKILNDYNLIKYLSEKSRKYAEKFTWDKIAEEHISLYQSILRNNYSG
ncbi:glycosyltransferase family 4 protein [Dictyoglomus thermophilum]|uniref:Glycosyl transferase, group 1 family protein n=2 Tax=Dictyoglomus thermophilum TaxID=14 RepID=B5YBH2_DICT6|nr:glycosyltransferase family 4 protein [Dictyoglomus thermophilum]ACI18817.1 glycosyl transferase, group 1 family protein [Dictyoglomus thermophilum H-6-12]TYT21023.1 glycosyltransferase family 4 protein [Dictyoglomus thermophilum]